MSGGSYSYIYSRLFEECAGRMYDEEMNDLIRDLSDVLHDLEWWQSSDISEEGYRESLRAFKAKWFKGNREKRLRKYVDEKMDAMKKEMYSLIGLESEKKMTDLDKQKYIVCCPLCDNEKCVRGTDKCEAEQWKKRKLDKIESEK